MEGREITRRIVDRLADLLLERIQVPKPLTLAEVAEMLRRELCSEWGKLKPPPGFEKGEECTLIPLDPQRYIERLREEIQQLANHIIDVAMEALAKHVEAMDDDGYARLSWLLVSHSSRVAYRLSKLASKVKEANPALVELAATLIALRALALYRMVSKTPSKTLERLLPNLEVFLAGLEGEEETLIEKLLETQGS